MSTSVIDVAVEDMRAGDAFRISSKRMCASGRIVKVNRCTVVYASVYSPRPGVEIPQTGKIEKHYFYDEGVQIRRMA